ncbi:aminotransferase class I/II-fold pyridoxal phosphate-dependent enzyme [Hymenobacter sp. HMF4947]|uniref:Aminotransferase class I/II-fold pyridoxal phosphate-dependent enzyme n=1 Tax=Hymenobacter ginkgonis TaxID=2682976 RepID=A0A7K1TLF2_9BACT|nr:PLP-dependent aminotransferase family protein [Hymenobacter ginkgonis]MVN79248.1 aminotransferase class I/II-fold pyridoxal phosphate-dependent enzyme [Hymenobacter ginkgonis]
MLRTWDTTLQPAFRSGRPVYLQISDLITVEIQRGRLVPGTALPGTRELAKQLGVNRKTAVLAYEELLAQGWLASQQTRGTFVADQLPTNTPLAFAALVGNQQPVAGFQWHEPPGPALWPPAMPGAITFTDGTPDARLAPLAALTRAYRHTLLSKGRLNQLGYESPLGNQRLREALAHMLNQHRGLSTTAETICLTRGTQMALYLTASLLLRPGDVVAVENPGYPPAWHTFQLFGAELAPLPVDDEGLCVEAFEALCRQRPVRALYLTPHHQFPTTVTLQAARRVHLLALAARYGVALVEDDYDHEFHYRYQPSLPLASADPGGIVIYIGSLTKLLAPALRIGYVTGPPAFVAALGRLRALVDRQGDTGLEQAVADLIDEGEIKRHTRRVQAEYHARRDTLVEGLRQLPADLVQFEVPAGGLALWVKFSTHVDVPKLARELARRRVLITPGSHYYLAEPLANAVRLGYAALKPSELLYALDQLRQVLCQSYGSR